MTDNVENYYFDFAAEVQRLKRELAWKADKILFVGVDVVPRSGDRSDIILSHVIGGKRLADNDIERLCKSVTHYYDADPERSPASHPLNPTDLSAGAVVFINNNYPGFKYWGAENENLVRLFALYHETVHALFPGRAGSNDDPFRECMADAYAALRLFQRFGREARPLLSLRSWLRSYEAIAINTAHFSTITLDRIIADSVSHDYFSSLSHAEIIKLASRYAKQSTPSPKMLAEARHVFGGVSGLTGHPGSAHYIADTALEGTSQLAAYIAAKYINPFLHRRGANFKGEHSSYSFRERLHYKALIRKHVNSRELPAIAQLLGPETTPSRLRRFFNRSAKKPFTKFLRVSVPAGQKRFTFKSP